MNGGVPTNDSSLVFNFPQSYIYVRDAVLNQGWAIVILMEGAQTWNEGSIKL